MKPLKIVGCDPSMKNWGLAGALLDPQTMAVQVKSVRVIQPVLPTGKKVRNNSKDLERAKQLYAGMVEAIHGADAIFIEIPVGSQSARAMAGYAICCGVIGSLLAQGFPVYEVTPTEVKLAGPGKKDASKAEMIEWAMGKHPEANWPTYRRHGEDLVSAEKAEHCADSVGAIYAGLKTREFQQLLPLLKRAA